MSINFPIFNGRTIITLDQFLSNPTGKGSSMVGKRQEIKKNLDERYYNLLKNHTSNGQFTYKVYIDGYNYIVIFKIPSETYKEISYDVVLEFVPIDGKSRNFSTISEYSINFFSNSPHMMFTYTYVLKQEKLLIDFLVSSKYSSEAMRNRPKVTNPVEIFGFEKSCYFACKFIQEKKLYSKGDLERNAIKMNRFIKMGLLDNIASQESKYKEYEIVKKRYVDERKRERAAKARKANEEAIHRSLTYNQKHNTSSYKRSSSKSTKKSSGFKSIFDKKKK